MLPKAVIDLGTNTFHLLIYTIEEGELKTIFRERKFVKLADEGIETISAGAIERALDAISSFRRHLDAYMVQEHRAVGTAAMRTASNAQYLIDQMKSRFDIHASVISGTQEARLIAGGVAKAMGENKDSSMIMDIGGGSVEFIFSQAGEVVSLSSLPIGVAILHQQFHSTDPLGSEEELLLRKFLQDQLRSILPALSAHRPTTMIGASGTFDVIADILQFPSEDYHQVSADLILSPLQKIVSSTLAERKADPQIPDNRIDMIVVAAVLIQEVLSAGDFTHVGISKFALKEGLAIAPNGAC